MTKENELLNLTPATSSAPQLKGEMENIAGNSTVDNVNASESNPWLDYINVVGGDERSAESEDLRQSSQPEESTEYSETFSDKLDLDKLPPLLKDIAETESDIENRDAMILSSLDILSGAMPSTFGVYDSRKVYPPFYLIIYAPPSSDKGKLNACKQLVQVIEKEIMNQNQQEQDEYQRLFAEYMALDKSERLRMNPPKEPPYRSLWIPANTTATAVYQSLSDNGGWGITFETEADTLSNALSSEYFDYSTGLRAAYHHEAITYRRRKDREYVNIEEPRWAILLTCTPGQIPLLFKSFENGLGSRFGFFHKQRRLIWRNVFEVSDKTIDQVFLEFGQRYKTIYDELLKREEKPLQVILSTSQQEEFNQFFDKLQVEMVGLYGDDMIASVRRLGLTCFRIAMVLTILRHEGSMPIIDFISQAIVCHDDDFRTAMTIANCLINHTAHVYSCIFNHDKDAKNSPAATTMSHQEKLLYNQLSNEFTTEDVRQAAIRLGINLRTAERYLGKFASKYQLAVRLQVGKYKKVESKSA